MEKEKNDMHYTAEDIRRYLEGQLPDNEMQAIEKAALEDPFLSDAIEGFQENLSQMVSLESGMEELNKRLNERINKSSNKNRSALIFMNWRVAASVLLIIGTAALTVTYLNNKNRKADLAKITKRDSGSDKINSRKPEVPAENPPALQQINEDSAVTINDQVQLEKQSSEKIKPLINKKKKTNYSDKSVTKPESEKSLGDSMGLPEEEAPVASSNNKDIKIIPAPKTTADQMKSSASGLAIEDKDQNRPGEKKLDEVIVIGYGAQKKKDVTGSTTVVVSGNKNDIEPPAGSTGVIVSGNNNGLEPQNGWEEYYNYLKNNKRIPAVDSLLKGEETISFVVHANGKLSSFKIEKSVSTAHDKELIRLVKEGPPWRNSGDRKQRCRLTYYFN
jgi:hypothetical protein